MYSGYAFPCFPGQVLSSRTTRILIGTMNTIADSRETQEVLAMPMPVYVKNRPQSMGFLEMGKIPFVTRLFSFVVVKFPVVMVKKPIAQ